MFSSVAILQFESSRNNILEKVGAIDFLNISGFKIKTDPTLLWNACGEPIYLHGKGFKRSVSRIFHFVLRIKKYLSECPVIQFFNSTAFVAVA